MEKTLASFTKKEVEKLWEQGFRPYEIYTLNKTPVEYCGETVAAGTVAGWTIEFVFSTREALESYPYFDAIIGIDCMVNVEKVWGA